MLISIRRYLHFILAAISSLFLVLASVTGIVLAVEPVQHQLKGHDRADLETVSLKNAIHQLDKHYDEVFGINVEPSGFVRASVLTPDFETAEVYVNPETGEQLAKVADRPEIYRWTTNLHRSLFLKSTGRVLVGVVSFLLVLLAVTGVLLMVRRQGSWRQVFGKVNDNSTSVRYHVRLGRWLLIPVIVIALSGVWLSLEKFGWTPAETKSATSETSSVSLEKMYLSDIKSVTFPFSSDPDDFYVIETHDSTKEVRQGSGQVQDLSLKTWSGALSVLAFDWHTGTGSIWWSLILLVSAIGLLYFIYSGAIMSYHRLRKKSVFESDALETAEFVVLVGTESGTSRSLAENFAQAIQQAGQTVYLDVMDGFLAFAKACQTQDYKMRELIIFTATYGDGDAPSSAKNFEKQLAKTGGIAGLPYSVVAFGSLDYPKFCAYGIKVDNLLAAAGLRRGMPLVKISDLHLTDVRGWASRWGRRHDLSIQMELPNYLTKKKKPATFVLTKKIEINGDETFLIWLSPKKKIKFVSGDLLGVIPPDSERARQYSIAKIGDQILLSIKRHEQGKCSRWLADLPEGKEIQAFLEPNPDFHLPEFSEEVIMISNGTGIAPFLGMIGQKGLKRIRLYWGGHTRESFKEYEKILDKTATTHKPEFRLALSREEGKYVQDLFRADQEEILSRLENGACIMICGSILMQEGVLETLETAFAKANSFSRQQIEEEGRLLMDCY